MLSSQYKIQKMASEKKRQQWRLFFVLIKLESTLLITIKDQQLTLCPYP